MSKHNSKVLKVYQQCQTVLKLKRNFIQEIQIPNLPNFQFNKQINDLKNYSTAFYIRIAVCKFFKEVTESYSMYKKSISSKKSIQSQISRDIKKIKNTKDLTSKHQLLQNQLDEMKKRWEKQDPLIYYEISERVKFKKSFQQKCHQFKEAQTGIKTIKNPHFVHQLINQMKQNLQKISQEDKRYDWEAQQNTLKITKYLKDLTKQMEINIDEIEYKSYIFQQKKKLFSQFVDQIEQNGSSGSKYRGSRHTNKIKHYFQQLLLTSKDIKNHFKKLIQFADSMYQFFKQVQQLLRSSISNIQKKYQQFIDQVHKNKQIRVILRIDIQQRINNNLKGVLSILQILKGIPNWIYDYKNMLIQCFNQANIYHDRYITKEMKFKQNTDSFQKMLIQHKGYFSSLEKKEQKCNKMNIQTLRRFVHDLYELMKIINQQNIKLSKYRTQINVHQTINKIFQQYNFNQQKNQLAESAASSTDNQSLNTQAKINDYQKFIQSIYIFDYSNLSNWNNQYFTCSLGPKLLIHGYLQTLEQGIYYESSFNKKNYFFGKTRLFIPKNDIYQVNKQVVLLVFPDIIEIKTNKGQVFFHALGKRDKMYDQFINIYFPEVQQTQNGLEHQIQYQFNQFKGQDVKDRIVYKLEPFAVNLGESILKNNDLRVIFRRYFSQDSFTYQGKVYHSFKTYQLQHIGGIDPTSNQITPPPPYYFLKKGQPNISNTVPQFSIRLATFYKNIPFIPFVSKGGKALCQQRIKYYWGDPNFFVVDIESTMKDFKMTQGMVIKIRSFFKKDEQKNQIKCQTSAQISFDKQGPLAGTIKTQALSQLKQVMRKTMQAMQKNQKNRSIYKNKGNNLQDQTDIQKQQFKDEIQKLKDQNKKLQKRIKLMTIVFIVIYFLTVLFLKWDSGQNVKIKQIQKQYEYEDDYYYEKQQDNYRQKDEQNKQGWFSDWL